MRCLRGYLTEGFIGKCVNKNISGKYFNPILVEMHFFLEYLSHFSASEVLHMYGEGAFRTCEEIKAADFTISFKIIFDDHHLTEEELEKYRHMQKVVDAIRAYQQANKSTNSTEESHRYFSSEAVQFRYFVKYSEAEKEVVKFNVFERRITFSFLPVHENSSTIIWLKDALDELLTYVLRDATEVDRVGLVIKYYDHHYKSAAFPIKSKNHLKASIIFDTLTNLVKSRGSVVTGQRMILQVVRIRLPILYKKLTLEDVVKMTGINI